MIHQDVTDKILKAFYSVNLHHPRYPRSILLAFKSKIEDHTVDDIVPIVPEALYLIPYQ